MGWSAADWQQLYFSVFAAANFYHLVDHTAAFALMGLVTLMAGGIAVRFDSMLIAVLGIIGAYGTPVLLPTGEVNFVGLYGYMLVLGIGVLGMCYWKNWPLVNLLSFIYTYALLFTLAEGLQARILRRSAAVSGGFLRAVLDDDDSLQNRERQAVEPVGSGGVVHQRGHFLHGLA